VIPKVNKRRADLAGTRDCILYLVSDSNHHENPRLVAGSDELMFFFDGVELQGSDAVEIANYLNETQQLFDVTIPAGHIWHCSLELPAVDTADNAKSDEWWAAFATDFVERMGFLGASGEAPCRFAVVRHGLSKTNQLDHVHVVVNLIREDGTKARTVFPTEQLNGKIVPVGDFQKAQDVCRELEREYGIYEVEGAKLGRSTVGWSQADQARSAAEFGVQPRQLNPMLLEQARLRAAVMAAGSAASNESEFVQVLRRSGIIARPWFAEGGREVVTGYSVALRTSGDGKLHWWGGGKLAHDLTLPRLRELWVTVPGSRENAVPTWLDSKDVGVPRVLTPQQLGSFNQRVAALTDQLVNIDKDDMNSWIPVARRLGGAFAQLSQMTESTPGTFAQAAEQLSAVSSTKLPVPEPSNLDLYLIADAAMMTRLAAAGTDKKRQIQYTARNMMRLFMAVQMFLDAKAQYRLASQVFANALTELDQAEQRLQLDAAWAVGEGKGVLPRRRGDNLTWADLARQPQGQVRFAVPTEIDGFDEKVAERETSGATALLKAQLDLANTQAEVATKPTDPAWLAHLEHDKLMLAVESLSTHEYAAKWQWATDIAMAGWHEDDVPRPANPVDDWFLTRALHDYAVDGANAREAIARGWAAAAPIARTASSVIPAPAATVTMPGPVGPATAPALAPVIPTRHGMGA